ncbi:hypothetical protein J6TS2_06750 [Heyndrickxia sporothermodurans]|nr:hypothetical protein J6TS2_06750 [Heyndrickxia sporothermodurans]
MYEVISNRENKKWKETLKLFNTKDIFYDYSYSIPYQSIGDGDPYLFFYNDEKGSKICYCFLKRKINNLPFLSDVEIEYELFDIITPSYGYGGPIYDVINQQAIINFRREFEEYCQKENIICEFIRFHPLLQNQKYMDVCMNISNDRETIFIDLTKSEDKLFHSYHKNHQRNIKKANKNLLTFKVYQSEEAIEVIDEFYELYKETMEKLNASRYSYFSTNNIKKLLKELSNHSMIAAVFLENRMIAAALCLYKKGSLHYHLGCSQKQYLNLGINAFLLHHIALWGKQKQMHTFHLGGGHVGRDSLFQFKYRFNPNGLLDFYIGKHVHDPLTYNWLVEKWQEYYQVYHQQDFFPVYRSLSFKLNEKNLVYLNNS